MSRLFACCLGLMLVSPAPLAEGKGMQFDGGVGGRVQPAMLPAMRMVPPGAMRPVVPLPTHSAFIAVLMGTDDDTKLFAVGTNAFTLPMFLRAPAGMAVVRNNAAAAFNALKAGDIVQVVYELRTGLPVQVNAVGPA
ncbi:MAG: hypothetical protein K2W96_17435 [Gemmataceae bacterium]|nr:hypothetical protein [Gemmataceae bacterium]